MAAIFPCTVPYPNWPFVFLKFQFRLVKFGCRRLSYWRMSDLPPFFVKSVEDLTVEPKRDRLGEWFVYKRSYWEATRVTHALKTCDIALNVPSNWQRITQPCRSPTCAPFSARSLKRTPLPALVCLRSIHWVAWENGQMFFQPSDVMSRKLLAFIHTSHQPSLVRRMLLQWRRSRVHFARRETTIRAAKLARKS